MYFICHQTTPRWSICTLSITVETIGRLEWWNILYAQYDVLHFSGGPNDHQLTVKASLLLGLTDGPELKGMARRCVVSSWGIEDQCRVLQPDTRHCRERFCDAFRGRNVGIGPHTALRMKITDAVNMCTMSEYRRENTTMINPNMKKWLNQPSPPPLATTHLT